MKKYINILTPLIILTLVGIFLFIFFQKKEAATLIPPIKNIDSPSILIGSRDKYWRTPEERRELCEKLGIIYSRTIVFADECSYLARIDPSFLQLDVKVKRSNPERSAYLKKCVSTEYQVPVYIKWVNDIIGYGVFADADISKDEFIMEYAGRVEEHIKDSMYSWAYPCVPGGFGFDKKRYIIDARIIGGEARFVNDPLNDDAVNVKLGLIHNDGFYHIIYIAARDIKAEEQLFIAYGEDYWKNRKSEPIPIETRTKTS